MTERQQHSEIAMRRKMARSDLTRTKDQSQKSMVFDNRKAVSAKFAGRRINRTKATSTSSRAESYSSNAEITANQESCHTRKKTYRLKRIPSPVERKGFYGAVRFPTDKVRGSELVRKNHDMSEMVWSTYRSQKDDDVGSKTTSLAESQAVRTVKNLAGVRQILKERKEYKIQNTDSKTLGSVSRRTEEKSFRSRLSKPSLLNRSQLNQPIQEKKSAIRRAQDKNSIQKQNLSKKNQSPLLHRNDKNKTAALKRNHTVKGLIRENVVAGIKNFQGSEDDGMKAITKTRDFVMRTRRAARAARKTGEAVYKIGKVTVKIFSAITKLLASVAPTLLPILMGIVLAMVCVTAITAIMPSFTLKSDDVEVSKIYKYVTELDAEFSQEVRTENTGADVYHFYLNGSEINRTSFEVVTNADSFIAYLDAKYQDYAFDKFIYGLFGGTNVKSAAQMSRAK
ncbi:hypothetical protein [Scatolibacter rhodanostii]|uniref:hypothetical protein n=1 Tax=Scatolibacter rhodanostii TaxID=2014781 RepID=UPI000C079BE8|nr:hypothetical protein [Scatolibacter rhodanostii]